jgi:PAS domain S-box-containing protein
MLESRVIVLLIEDSKIDQMAFKRLVREKNLVYDYAIASSITEAKEILSTQTFDIILCDHDLGDGTAFEIFSLKLEIPVIVVTGTGSEFVAVQAMKAGAYDYLIKDPDGHYLQILPLVIDTAIKYRQTEAQYRLLSHALEQIRDCVYVTNAEDFIIFVNQAFCKTYGYQSQEIIGKKKQIFCGEDSSTQDETNIDGELDISYSPLTTEIYHYRQDGSIFPASVSCSIMQHEGQKVNIFISRDITLRKQTEAEIKQLNANLQQRTIELEICNKELEAFSYSVSHDLRNPLTGIKGFTWMLLNKYSQQLDAQGKKCLEHLDVITRHMEELIEDLLKLSQIAKTEINIETVNLSQLARDIAQDLQKTQSERLVEFIITPDICVQGDRRLLKIALENLLGNAWKYTSKKPQARIEFGVVTDRQIAEKHNLEVGEVSSCLLNVYFISDNGAGFDMVDAGKLFTAFQRLHNSHEFEGTGVGLATVQRIIQRHRGKIWVQAFKDEGATFYFNL